MQERAAQSWENFYPRPPRGGRPLRVEASAASIPDFYPRPPRGGRRPSFSSPRIRKRFLSTPSARRATELRRQHRLPTPNFYPRPPRGGRRRNPAPQPREAHFYPRPPRGGRPQATPSASDRLISIHALREEGDSLIKPYHVLLQEFLSTPSARRATLYPALSLCPSKFLSTPSARRATPFTPPAGRGHQKFLSTPSARRATHIVGLPSKNRVISIHALREEGDTYCSLTLKKLRYFYPRPPRGGRRATQVTKGQ